VSDKILLITPPDKVFNQSKSCLMIHPGETIRQEYQNILADSKEAQNIYLYNLNDDEHDIDWLLSIANTVDVIIFDIDNSSQEVKMLASYLVSLPKTYWLTKEDTWCYSKLSMNRVYGLDTIQQLLGGKVEQEQ
jgi:hypothetical protein